MAIRYKSDWIENGSLKKLLGELNEGTELNENGSITFTARDHSELFDLLADGIVGPNDIGHEELSALATRAFLDLRKGGEVDLEGLIAKIRTSFRQRNREPLKSYAMWTKLRLQHLHHGQGARFQIDDITIELTNKLPRYLQLEEHFVSGVGRIDPNRLPFFGFVIVRSRGRNATHGSRKLFNGLELFYAAVNTAWRSVNFWEQRRPNAKFWEGPHQFIFEDGKFLGENCVWYNPEFREDVWNLFPPKYQDFLKRKQIIRRVLNQLEGHPLREGLVNALQSISSGMESQNLSFRLMRFWSAAEILYAPNGERTSSKKIIDRLTFATSEDYRWLDKLKLSAAYEMRNSYVHRGVNDNDTSLLVQNLREVVIRHVYYLIFSGSDIRTQADLIRMVDMPSTVVQLDSLALAIDRRRNILSSGYHASD